MKLFSHTHSNRKRHVVIAAATSLLIGICALNQISAASHADYITRNGVAARQDQGTGRLVIHRIANLGNNVIVNLSIDGVPTAFIAYGHTYADALPVGRHVLSVSPEANAKWKTPFDVTLDVSQGQIYNLIVMDDGSGRLILRGA